MAARQEDLAKKEQELGERSEEMETDAGEAARQQPGAAGPSAPAAVATPSAMPSLPERPKGGLPALPPRGSKAGPAATAAATAAKPAGEAQSAASVAAASAAGPAASAAGPASDAVPAGMPKLPPRPGMGAPTGLGLGLGPKPTAAAAPGASPAAPIAPAAVATPPAAAQQQQPAVTAPAAGAGAPAGLGRGLGVTGPLRPSLPPRPSGATAGGATAGTQPRPGAPAAGAVAAPAAGASAAPRAAGGLGALPPRPAGLAPATAPAAVAPTAAPGATAAAVAPVPSSDVVDPTESRRVQKVQRTAHEIRVRLIRAATRLGLSARSDQVAQFLQAIERSERMVGAQHYKGSRRVDLIAAAERDARAADTREPPLSPIAGLRVKIMVLGMTGTGKSELINSLLDRPATRADPFRKATCRVRVLRGLHNGIPLTFIDTPGLLASASCTAENKAILRRIRAAYHWHKPDYVFYVDRLDATRPGLGELGLLTLITEALGAGVWRNTMAVLTHAHAARNTFGPQYDINSRQRRNIISQLLRQAAGDQQTRNPVFLADCHPGCPTNSLGQQVILEGPQQVPWKQQLLVQLVGYKSYNMATATFKELAKAKGGKAAAAGGARGPQDIFKRLMRSRLPPLTFFVEQMCEGVLKPEGMAIMEPVAGLGEEITEDEEAESFLHVYYRHMWNLAVRGNPWAQREIAAMVRAYDKAKQNFKQSYVDSELDQIIEYGIESYVVDPIDFGPSFDPEDLYSYRHAYAEAGDTGVNVIPSQDYYGPEHDDPLNGIVVQYESQPFTRLGWGGYPFDLTLCVEKNKNSLCLQGESHVSVVHTVPPFGRRHVTQVTGSWEMLRPNIKDVMYQLEVNTFKDGLLGKTDHAGCGLMLARLGEGGDPRKGPVAVGVRLQDTARLGAFKVEACAAKVSVQGPTGGKEEGWGGRAFVHYDWLPGVGFAFDFIQQRTNEKKLKISRRRGYGMNITYDWEALGAAFGMEVDYMYASDSVFVSVNAFSGNDYRLGWLLLLPAVNYAKETLRGLWSRLRGGGGAGEEDEEEEGEGEEGEGEGEEGEEAAMMMMPGMEM